MYVSKHFKINILNTNGIENQDIKKVYIYILCVPKEIRKWIHICDHGKVSEERISK